MEDLIHRKGPATDPKETVGEGDVLTAINWLFKPTVLYFDNFPTLADVWNALAPDAWKRH